MAKSIQVQKVLPWMERLADYMIAYPGARMTELAKLMDRTLVWVSIAKNSDCFKDYWAVRSKAHSEAVTADIKAKGFAVAEMALEALSDKLETQAPTMTVETLLSVVDTTLKRVTPGNIGPGPQINLNLGLVTPEQLAAARERMRRIESPVIDLQPDVEVKDAS